VVQDMGGGTGGWASRLYIEEIKSEVQAKSLHIVS
jgi:hypothetical protein